MFTGRQKAILSVLILLGLLFYPVYIAKAISGWLIVLKEYVLDLIARLIARVLGSIMSNAILKNALESGRPTASGKKTPAFVQDWRGFFQTAQHRGEDIAGEQLANAIFSSNPTICPHLRTQLAAAFQVNSTPLSKFDYTKYRTDAVQYFKERNKCSLPTNFNLAAFGNSFTQGGGWSTWQKLIQPQNNIYGVYADSFRELQTQRGFESGLDKSEVESGSGYTSKRSGCEGGGTGRPRCVIWGKSITPAKLFGDTGANAMKFELEFIGVSDEIAEVVAAVVGVLIDRLADYASEKLLSEAGPGIGADAPPPDAAGRAAQDCVDACIVTNCPPGPDVCTTTCTTDPVTGVETCTETCTPGERDPACVSNCQAQGCQ